MFSWNSTFLSLFLDKVVWWTLLFATFFVIFDVFEKRMAYWCQSSSVNAHAANPAKGDITLKDLHISLKSMNGENIVCQFILFWLA